MSTVQLKHSFGEPTLMGPGGAPKGHPKWGPTRLTPKYTFVWYQSIRLDAYFQFTTSFCRTDPHGARESPQRAPQMGIHPTSTEIHLRMVSIDSSRCILSIYNILLENRPSWAPRSTKGHPKWGPRSGPIAHPCLLEVLPLPYSNASA